MPDFLPLYEELSPTPDAWDVCRRLARFPYVLFLDSAMAHPNHGRYSFVAADPFEKIESRPGSADPFPLLALHLRNFSTQPIAGLPPFQGGLAGLFGYDLCHHIERLPRPRFDEFKTPDLAVGLYDWVVAFDHAADRAWIISTGLPETDPAARTDRARARLKQVRRALLESSTPTPKTTSSPLPESSLAQTYPLTLLPGLRSNFDRQGYEAAVRRAVDYVHAGDCFQVNISQRLLHPADFNPLELYSRLRERNPAPFAGYFDLGDFVILSASPERFLHLADSAVATRPIKGTRPRGPTPDADLHAAADLRASAKDRAENVMIIDLLRNDLGRVCVYGSVEVTAAVQLETYRTVHHLVSEVRGRLRPGLGPVDLLRACWPGGSVTGAPKVRALEIIAELEPTARGPYCGSLGYLGFDGSMDLNLLIRTFAWGRGWLQFPVGGGVVADSAPAAEYAETLHKAEGMLRALR